MIFSWGRVGIVFLGFGRGVLCVFSCFRGGFVGLAFFLAVFCVVWLMCDVLAVKTGVIRNPR